MTRSFSLAPGALRFLTDWGEVLVATAGGARVRDLVAKLGSAKSW